jgi:carbon monoxide dehydrogenase subunit G
MQFNGSVEINADRESVWQFVVDPTKVGSCGPGVESVDVIDDTHFKATAKVGVGFISARFKIDLELVDTEEPIRAVIKARGQAPGNAVDALGTMHLTGPPDGPTTMAYIAEVNVMGTMASVGARLIDSTANKMIAQTFDCIRARLEGEPSLTA